MKLLYITRKFPPMVGGMEKLSYALAKEFSRNSDTTLITWGKSQKYLPFFIFLACLKALYYIPKKQITHVYIGDALLAPLGLFLKIFFKIKLSITVVGLDITFNFPGYQLLIPKCVSQYDKIFCISTATEQECVKRGILKEKCIVIPCGIYPKDFNKNFYDLDTNIIKSNFLRNKKILITVGRLVRRKGVLWFVTQVFPKLDNNLVYLIIGEGPDKQSIKEKIQELNLKDRVFLLGKVSDNTVRALYKKATIFVMPNIPVDHTIEGFGIVAIEASSSGLPVIASDIEGISDAVVSHKNGILVPPQKEKAWILGINQTIQSPLSRKKIRTWTNTHFNWEIIGRQYMKYL